MGVVVLTTDTLHHAYFVRELSREATIDWVLLETSQLSAPFETAHPYETRREAHERAVWFDGASSCVGEFAETWRVESVNDGWVLDRLRKTDSTAVIVFGTGRLKLETIAACGTNALNLHGGDTAGYRGLDSHLWAIYHREYEALVTTLHKVNAELDRGDVVSQGRLAIHHGMELHELRRVNTEMCLRLTTNALRGVQKDRGMRGTPQSTRGRYYSHMPAVLKNICVDRFAAHTRTLP